MLGMEEEIQQAEQVQRLKFSKLAIISFIFGLIPALIYPFAFFLNNRIIDVLFNQAIYMFPISLILGFIALREIKRNGLRGKWLALFGISIGIIILIYTIWAILYMLIVDM